MEYSVEERIRLDKFLVEKNKNLSRAMIQKQIEGGYTTVNGKKEKASYLLKPGDKVVQEECEVKKWHLQAQEIPLEVIYEDQDMIVINKEKGMVVHPGNGNEEGTVANAILAKCKDSLSGIGGEIRPGIVHRLDKDTSGILLVAKNDAAHIALSRQIQERTMKKTYFAVVRGQVMEQEATINMPIARSVKDRKKMAVVKQGKEAITHFKVLTRYEDCTLLEVQIETGRTHQIRVHLAQIGHPVIGDSTYSNGKSRFDVTGQMLHAKKIAFLHPRTKEKMELEAKLPLYFQKILDKLEEEKQ